MTTHTIVVGNVGTVCTTTDSGLAFEEFDAWTKKAKQSVGRAASEPVTWLRDGEPYREYLPPYPFNVDFPDHELTASQLAVKYSPNGDGEHPEYTVLSWIAAAQLDDVRDSYWGWVRLRVTTEHEDAAEAVNVHNFTVAVTAPATLSRDDVLELLNLFCSAATQELEDTQGDGGADKDERERAAKALTMNVEVL